MDFDTNSKLKAIILRNTYTLNDVKMKDLAFKRKGPACETMFRIREDFLLL